MVSDTVINAVTLTLTTAIATGGTIYAARVTRRFNTLEDKTHEIKTVVTTPDHVPPIGTAVGQILEKENGSS